MWGGSRQVPEKREFLPPILHPRCAVAGRWLQWLGEGVSLGLCRALPTSLCGLRGPSLRRQPAMETMSGARLLGGEQILGEFRHCARAHLWSWV